MEKISACSYASQTTAPNFSKKFTLSEIVVVKSEALPDLTVGAFWCWGKILEVENPGWDWFYISY